jgi:hypothetical protein
MNSSLSESVQQQVRPGKCVDLYYPDPQTAEKACIRTTVNTRFQQAMTNLSAGTSTFTIPPNNGIQDIVMNFSIDDYVGNAALANGLGLNRGWGYALIKSVSFRYGGSSQFFLTGQQILQLALRKCPNGFSRDDLLALGGQASTAATLVAAPAKAYCWLPLPHCVPTAEGKLPPFPSDLLTQQIVVQIEIFPVSSIFSVCAGATGTPATSLDEGSFTVQQVLFENQGDALARRVDMSTHALSYPVEFTQQEITLPITVVTPATDRFSVTLTGFRAGECRSIHAWLTRDADTSGAVKNPFAWYAPQDVVLTYAGERYSVFPDGSGALWNLVNGRLSPQASDVYLTDNGAGGGAGVIVITGTSSDNWIELPFAQTFDPLTAHSMYTSGKNITNGIVNLEFSPPRLSKTGAALPAGAYTLHISYNYNAVLMLTGGTADYVL